MKWWKCNLWRIVRSQTAPNKMDNVEAVAPILFFSEISLGTSWFLSFCHLLLFCVKGLTVNQIERACFTMSSAWLILQSICSGSFSLWNLCLLRTNTNTCGTNRKQTKGFKSMYQPLPESSHLTDGAINKTVKWYDCVKVPLSANNPLLSYYCRLQMDSSWE